ncbi:hypothetical protein B0A50_01928 [Salinomyces thailandicus]|uniref:Calcineurin-like phosphoesterase domain-containing protein n=1 Tax=Salinomyces thailandicus TaxID=706561 RepID=A0A4U0U6W9_9PEZI|nr:hypothetical protein B0A50_01928 [Salinomyces thailandica]
MADQFTKTRIICVSDTHNKIPGEGYTLPAGDILVHAGDLTNQGSYLELQKAVSWLEQAKYPVKFVVAGNHDLSLDSDYHLKYEEGWKVQSERVMECMELFSASRSLTYLRHTGALVDVPGKNVSVRVFGSPYSPDGGPQNWAFQYLDSQAADLWSSVPDVDILISHTPPKGFCDTSKHWDEGGCQYLREVLWRIRPLLHVCGHCHEGRGAKIVRWGEDQPAAIEAVREWIDPGIGCKKQSLLDLTGAHGGQALEAGKETAIVNASVMAKSFGKGATEFNKPIVVDLLLRAEGSG